MTACVKSRQDILVIIASIVTIIISITCAAVVSTKSRQMQMIAQAQSTRKGFDWCLPCEVLANRGTPDLLEKLNKTLIGSVQHYCAYNKEQVEFLLELMSFTYVEEVPKTLDAGDFALSRASAHQHLTVSGFHNITNLVFPVENEKLGFDVTMQDQLTAYARHVTVTKSAMTVQLPGLYYIYSSVFFQHDTGQSCWELSKQIWEHNIVLSRSDGTTDEVVFTTTYTCCDTCGQDKKTSYTGGLFDLKENDRLHVEVSSVGIISFREEGTYFGLFMLG